MYLLPISFFPLSNYIIVVETNVQISMLITTCIYRDPSTQGMEYGIDYGIPKAYELLRILWFTCALHIFETRDEMHIDICIYW